MTKDGPIETDVTSQPIQVQVLTSKAFAYRYAFLMVHLPGYDWDQRPRLRWIMIIHSNDMQFRFWSIHYSSTFAIPPLRIHFHRLLRSEAEVKAAVPGIA